jgi:hypothetical protein
VRYNEVTVPDDASNTSWLGSIFGGVGDFFDGLLSRWRTPSSAPSGLEAPGVDPPPAPATPEPAPVLSESTPATSPAAPPARRNESVVYLGINPMAREHERAAFANQDNATIITGSGTDTAMDGKVMSRDGQPLDLSNEDDFRRYMREVGVGSPRTDAGGNPTETPEQAAARMAQMEDLFLGRRNEDGVREGGISPGARDEMAQFVEVLQRVEAGEMSMERVVMSGHSTGDWVYGEAEGDPGVTFQQMAELMSLYPTAQAGVEDFMLSACHTLEDYRRAGGGDHRDGKQYQQIFPNLTNVWGYDGFSPNYKQGSTRHIERWLTASEGDNPQTVPEAARRTGQNAKAIVF